MSGGGFQRNVLLRLYDCVCYCSVASRFLHKKDDEILCEQEPINGMCGQFLRTIIRLLCHLANIGTAAARVECSFIMTFFILKYFRDKYLPKFQNLHSDNIFASFPIAAYTYTGVKETTSL